MFYDFYPPLRLEHSHGRVINILGLISENINKRITPYHHYLSKIYKWHRKDCINNIQTHFHMDC